MIKVITETLIDAFCASMLVGFFYMGIAVLIVPMIDAYTTLWVSLASFPFFVIGLVCFMLLDRSRS